MIPIPNSVHVRRTKADETKLTDAARTWLEGASRAEGFHASDAMDPRRAFFRKMLPSPLSDREVGLFLVGKVLHAFVLGAMAGKVDLEHTDEGSKFNEELGVWYSPDWDRSEIAEFKTSRAFKEPVDNEDLGIYIEQVLIYMACENRTEAKIWVQYVNLRDPETRRTTPAFRCFAIKIAQEDLDGIKSHIKEVIADYNRAIADGDFKRLDLCRDWLCGRRMCQWYETCQPEGRFGTSKFDA